MLKVGVTGGIASGKSTVCRLFVERHQVPLIDTDLIAHQLVTPGAPTLTALVATFGDSILRPDQTLDRAALRQRVFAEGAALQALEAVMHPAIRTEVRRQWGLLSAPYALIAIPLLVERGWQGEVDRVLVVDLPEPLQRQRAQARDASLDTATLDAILQRQASRTQRLACADDRLDNQGDTQGLLAEVDRLHAHYLALAEVTEVRGG